MQFDLRTPEARAYAALTPHGERHQLNWVIQDGAITPRLTCLHGNLPEGFRCAAQTLAESPELLAPGYDGTSNEVRDGIIVSRWVGGRSWYGMYSDDDGAELIWHYEEEDLHRSVTTQRHTLRFVIGESEIEPVFDCLHAGGSHCDAAFWRDDAWLFPEWHAGPDTALRAGTIVSWWSTGEPTPEELPYWAYEEHAAGALITSLTQPPKREAS
jgi:hypothetical protein